MTLEAIHGTCFKLFILILDDWLIVIVNILVNKVLKDLVWFVRNRFELLRVQEIFLKISINGSLQTHGRTTFIGACSIKTKRFVVIILLILIEYVIWFQNLNLFTFIDAY